MLANLNGRLQALMPILTPASLVLGVLLENVGHYLLFLIPWIFAFMTFSSSLSLNLKGLQSFKKYPFVLIFTLIFLHGIMPLWAYIISTAVFDDHLLTIGYMLAVAVPTGVSSFIWISICLGHLALGLSIILIDTLLSPIIIPLLIHVVSGQAVHIDTQALIIDLILMIVVPSLAGVLLHEWTHGKIEQILGKTLAPFSKISIFAIVMINASIIAPYVKNITMETFMIIIVVFAISISGYVFALVLGHFLWKDVRIITSFVFTGGMRNIAVGVVLASTYFPAKVVMPVVFGMLFQQILASIFSKVIEKYKIKYA